MTIYEIINTLKDSVHVTLFDTSAKTVREMFTRTTVGELKTMSRGCDLLIDEEVKDWEWKSLGSGIVTELRITI